MIIQVILAIFLICIALFLFFGTSNLSHQSTNCFYCKYFDTKTQKCTNKNSLFFNCIRKKNENACNKWGYFYDEK